MSLIKFTGATGTQNGADNPAYGVALTVGQDGLLLLPSEQEYYWEDGTVTYADYTPVANPTYASFEDARAAASESCVEYKPNCCTEKCYESSTKYASYDIPITATSGSGTDTIVDGFGNTAPFPEGTQLKDGLEAMGYVFDTYENEVWGSNNLSVDISGTYPDGTRIEDNPDAFKITTDQIIMGGALFLLQDINGLNNNTVVEETVSGKATQYYLLGEDGLPAPTTTTWLDSETLEPVDVNDLVECEESKYVTHTFAWCDESDPANVIPKITRYFSDGSEDVIDPPAGAKNPCNC